MKRPKRAIRIVRRKKEHGNPKDFDELVIMPFQGNVIAQIGDTIILGGKILNNENNKTKKRCQQSDT